MAMGLKKENEDDALIDFTKELWATKVPKKTWKLSMSDLKEEISQQVGIQEPPRFKHWSVKRSTDWLISNLIMQLGDVEYIHLCCWPKKLLSRLKCLHQQQEPNMWRRGKVTYHIFGLFFVLWKMN
jgi:hypothetical protein